MAFSSPGAVSFCEHLWTAPPWQEILVGHLQVGR